MKKASDNLNKEIFQKVLEETIILAGLACRKIEAVDVDGNPFTARIRIYPLCVFDVYSGVSEGVFRIRGRTLILKTIFTQRNPHVIVEEVLNSLKEQGLSLIQPKVKE